MTTYNDIPSNALQTFFWNALDANRAHSSRLVLQAEAHLKEALDNSCNRMHHIGRHVMYHVKLVRVQLQKGALWDDAWRRVSRVSGSLIGPQGFVESLAVRPSHHFFAGWHRELFAWCKTIIASMISVCALLTSAGSPLRRIIDHHVDLIR